MPLVVHTAGVGVVKLTARPELAMAATTKGDGVVLRFASGSNVIVCATRVTRKFCETGAAGRYVLSPAWSACTVHVPGPTRLIVVPFVPDAVHTNGVVVENVTGRSDVDTAL